MPDGMNALEAQAIARLMFHLDGGQILAKATIENDVNYLIAQAGASIGMRLDVQVGRVMETLALVSR